MPLISLPDESFNNILFFLDYRSLHKCLLVNRYWCRFSAPNLWREPFKLGNSLIINTLLSCLDEDEISSLTPFITNLNNQPPLFEYGKFIRMIDHEYFVESIINWLKSSSRRLPTGRFDVSEYKDCRVQKLVDAIYHMIMRQGSNLQKFDLSVFKGNFYIDLPKLSTFTTYKPGITNLRSLCVYIDLDSRNDMRYQNTIEFLSMVSKFCNGIVNCDLRVHGLNSMLVKPFLNIIKFQPLEKMLMHTDNVEFNVKKIIYALKFRSKTLKELSFDCFDFRGIDLSFVSKLERLEQLRFKDCKGFTSKHHQALTKKKLHLKELNLWFNDFGIRINVMEAIIRSLGGESLRKLSFNIVTPETVRAVKDFCPNVSFLHVKIFSGKFLNSIIPLICGLPSLKILHIQINPYSYEFNGDLVRILSNYLTSVECLFLHFFIDLPTFKYFTNNCRANLKKWIILDNSSLRKDYLRCVNNFQRIHNSLKVLGIENYRDGFDWTSEELEIVGSLKNQDVDIVSSSQLEELFY